MHFPSAAKCAVWALVCAGLATTGCSDDSNPVGPAPVDATTAATDVLVDAGPAPEDVGTPDTLAIADAEVDAADGADAAPEGPLEPELVAAARRGRLRWKRVEAFANDLASALSLPRDEVCRELGVVDCFDVHRLSLGAAQPFEKSLYEPAAAPQITTAASVDRIVLTACVNRVDADRSGAPVVFTHVDLDSAVVDPQALRSDAEGLYQRFHGRDATSAELELVLGLAVDDTGAAVSGRDAAVLACFAVGSTTEFTLY